MIPRDFHNPVAIRSFIEQALNEDIGDGDITTKSSFNNDISGAAHCLVKEKCTIAGIDLAIQICNYLDPQLEVNFTCKDGDIIEDVPACVGVISGKLSSILQIERVLLNTMQRMSGIASLTKQYVQLAQPAGIDIYDTRKTTPNFRLSEKWAVVIGGGVNHRFGLDDQILIKDNHIKAAADIQSALDNCLSYCNQQNIQIPVIVEVKDEQEFLIALKHKIVNRILIDNHSPEVLEKYIQYRNTIAPTKKLEISGGINLDNIKPYLIPGINCISVGALTHHAISVDISLKIV
jgi:nicotinate-nucleotide pyrophosphorylase (carboxylating)